jgi:hypothetical protein
MQRSEGELATLHGDQDSFVRATVFAAVAAATLLASPPILGEEIRIDRGDCTTGVHLVARGAHLSDVLKGLARTLDFQLSFEADSDPLINVDATMLPGELLARLASDGNISATVRSDLRCPGQTDIVKLWVLSSGRSNLQLPASTVQLAGQPQGPATQIDKTQEAVESFLAETHGFKRTTAKASP